MDLLLILSYAALCVAIFKIFKIPLNKWTVPTAVLGGVVIIGTVLMLMNYNHPYTPMAKQIYFTTPIVPAVGGIVVEVPIEANKIFEKGEVLFKIDPKPYAAVVEQKRALLAEGSQSVLGLETSVAAARARVVELTANMDRSYSNFQRYERGGTKVFSQVDIENRQQLYLSNKAAVERADADLDTARLAFESEIDGDNPQVARYRADLDKARYDLERTVVRAPTSGYVTQLLLRPGMMAASLPLRPVMVFVHDEEAPIVAAFRQNSLMRIKAGFEAEVVFPSIPGRTFAAKVAKVPPVIAEGQVQASGVLLGTEIFQTIGRVPIQIMLEDDISEFNLPSGSRAQVAVYSDSFESVSIMRKILLRMSSWQNYLFFDH
ncbi:MAG: multidrug resistance efflux pump [Halioglobus sp.]|jgi:multidrug resistance efflux pump